MDLRRLTQVLALMVAIGAIVIVFFIPLDSESYAAAGYSGIFTFSFLTGIFPGPTTIAIFLAAARFQPFWIALVAGVGSALGESSSYLAGYGSNAIIDDVGDGPGGIRRTSLFRWFEHNIARWMAANPTLTIFMFSLVPNPLIDVAGIVAGRVAFPFGRYLVATTLGKIGRFAIVAFLGDLWLA